MGSLKWSRQTSQKKPIDTASVMFNPYPKVTMNSSKVRSESNSMPSCENSQTTICEAPIASHEGKFRLGTMLVTCAVLPDGRRIIKQASFLKALGRSPSTYRGSGVSKTCGENPIFLRSKALIPFITNDLISAATPVRYKTKNGRELLGYDASSLPEVAEVYLKMRDSCLLEGKEVQNKMRHLVIAADTLIRGLCKVGVISLIDECTGYQNIREDDALQKILDMYITEELQKWTRKFPGLFFQLYRRMYGIVDGQGNPMHMGLFIKHYIYKKLPDGVVDELEHLNPKINDSGRRAHAHHQFLTPDIGHLALDKQIIKVMTVMRLSKNRKEFDSLWEQVEASGADA